MLGQFDPNLKKTTVIGAGISGLLLAYELDRRGHEVTLIEATHRTGGLILTAHGPNGIAETAAHSFLATPRVKALCEDLGVELLAVRKHSRARWIWRRGRMRRMPLSFSELAQMGGRVLLALAPRLRDPGSLTLEEWAKRFLGRPALEFLLNPFIRGVFAARPSELTIGSAFPSLSVPQGHSIASLWFARKVTRRIPSYPRRIGPRPMMAPRDGMGSLVEALTRRLEARLGSRFIRGSRINELPEGAGTSFNLALCVPSQEAARLLRAREPELSNALKEIPYAPLVTATIFADRASFASPPIGVGVLIPEAARERSCLGILFNSSSFEGRSSSQDVVSLTMMIGGTSDPTAVDLSDDALQARIEAELREILGLRSRPREVLITRWGRAIPIYGAAQTSARQVAQVAFQNRPGLVLFGNYTGQVSLRGMIESLDF